MNRLKEKYQKEIMPELKKDFGIKNDLAVPKVRKVVINAGVGDMIKNKEQRANFMKDISIICGQMPSVKLSKISVAGFGLRQGMPVGVSVTLRGERMYAFLDRLISVVLPRLRDFRGLSRKSIDAEGNYSLGIKEHTIFPEIDSAKSNAHGMEITVVTNTKNKEYSEKLLEYIGIPFEK